MNNWITATNDYNNDETQISPDTLTLEFVKAYLRIEHDLDDLEIEVYMKAAISYVRNYIKIPQEEQMEYELIIPILALTAHYYENKTVVQKATEKIDMMISSCLDMNRRNIL